MSPSSSRSGYERGYFDDHSMLRRVHRERVIALSGPRALLMQAAHPLAVAGLLAHSSALTREEEAAYWQDYRTVGRLFGLRAGDMPRTLAVLDGYRRSMLEGDTLVVTDGARERARAIVLDPPVPLAARPLVEIRRQYGFSPLPPAFVRKALVRAGGSM
jgi:uncharacterized protein (DUF2236 family)